MKEIVKRIKVYKEIKADITYIDLKLQELEDEMLGISGISYEEKTGPTYKISSTVESQAMKHLEAKERLLREKKAKIREIEKINNALSILKEEEKDVIITALIEGKKYAILEVRYDRSYSRVKQIESEALKKMKKYL